MSAFGLFFRAERIKWRKSWALLLAILAPVCQTGFLFTILWYSEALMHQFKPGFRFWFEISYLAWGLVMMPILAALVSELSWGLEEESRAWDHLLFQPVPRRTHYLVKLLSHFSLLLLSQLLLAALLVPAGLILRSNPYLGMGPLPWWALARFAGFTALASIPLVAIHTWLSVRTPGLGAGMAAALVGTWLCARMGGSPALAQLLPWGMAGQLTLLLDRSRQLPWGLFLGSLACAALVAYLGTLDFARRSESRS